MDLNFNFKLVQIDTKMKEPATLWQFEAWKEAGALIGLMRIYEENTKWGQIELGKK